MNTVTNEFASLVFDDKVMKENLSDDVILQKMAELRIVADEAETLTAEKYRPFPTYDKLLFGV